MKKRLITTMLKRILAMLAVLLLGLTAANPAYAETEPAPYASVEVRPNLGTPDSGTFWITLSPNHGGIFTVTTDGNTVGKPYTEVAGDVPISKTAEIGFSGVAPGVTVLGCFNVDFQEPDICSVPYVVPGVHTIPDIDKDGVKDNIDLCPETPIGTVVDGNGCAIVVQPVDTDGDGVADDHPDLCANTPAGTVVDVNGCAVVTVRPDVDGDGVFDDGPDECLGTLPGVVVDGKGCPIPVPPADVKTVSANLSSIADSLAKCGEDALVTGGQFNITQYTEATPSINVILSDGSAVNVALSKQTNGMLQYDVALSPGIFIDSATAVVPSDWTGKFVLSHYNCYVPEVPVTCPEGKDWTDANDNGKVDEGECHKPVPPVDVCPEDGHQPEGTECEPVVTPVTCPEGKDWTDANDNGKVDEGECHKPVPPVVVPPPVVVVPPAVVVTPLVIVPVVTEVDETNGRGGTVETAAVETATPVVAAVGSENQLGAGLIGLAILTLVTVAAKRRQRVSSE